MGKREAVQGTRVLSSMQQDANEADGAVRRLMHAQALSTPIWPCSVISSLLAVGKTF